MRVTGPFLAGWPDVDIELRTAFRFDGIAALQAHEIDLLVTPDPVGAPGLRFYPVFDYELLLAVAAGHPLARKRFITPQDLLTETLYTLPMPPERLDIYSRFLLPAGCRPKRRVGIETTDLMLQLTAAARGVTALPDWPIGQDAANMPLRTLRIGETGLHKSINLGLRSEDRQTGYIDAFRKTARQVGP